MSSFLQGASGSGTLSNVSYQFSNNKFVSGTREFLQSNGLVAKVAFLVLVVILFVVILRLGTQFIGWLYSPSGSPYIVKGLKNAKHTKIVSTNPTIRGSKPILRSVNERYGIEFTWTVWLFIDDLEYRKGQLKHIFHKGDDKVISQDTEIFSTSTAPALYLHQNKNAFIIYMNTFGTMNEKVVVNDVPLNKWINVAIRIEGSTMDVYINGKVVLRHIFADVPKQNYGDTYVNANGGYSGLMSDLWYHNKALTGVEIMDIVRAGPDLTTDESIKVFPPYFSLLWYFQNARPDDSP